MKFIYTYYVCKNLLKNRQIEHKSIINALNFIQTIPSLDVYLIYFFRLYPLYWFYVYFRK